MRMGRAQDIAKRHAGQRHIVHIPPAAPDQPRILEAGYGLTYSELLHRPALLHLSFACRRRHVKGGRYQVQGLSCKSFRLVGWAKAHHAEQGYWRGPSCAFAHAVRPHRLTAWAKSRT